MEQEDKIKMQVREQGVVLAGGIFAIGFCLFILWMDFRYPSAGGNRPVLVLCLLLMSACGAAVCAKYAFHRVSVEGMNIYYVNSIGKERSFSLDDIGYCRLALSEGGEESLTLYDLLGDKLCKLELHMRDSDEFLQYLLDNQVKIERPGTEREPSHRADSLLCETAICREEIGKCAEAFYGIVSPVFAQWETRYKRFDARWEFGLAEYARKDIEPGTEMWRWKGRTGHNRLPEDYVCALEAYLKRGEEYVMNRKGHAVSIFLPYIRRTRSYQIGEQSRIRKTDEAYLKEQLALELARLAEELPGGRYYTQRLELGHSLGRSAGI